MPHSLYGLTWFLVCASAALAHKQGEATQCLSKDCSDEVSLIQSGVQVHGDRAHAVPTALDLSSSDVKTLVDDLASVRNQVEMMSDMLHKKETSTAKTAAVTATVGQLKNDQLHKKE